ncbi:MAG: hypothetical protein KAS48_03425, partial [Gammaproteobacteria bacterium]|nr:hypothetical protein [Gammaproteobacteria bacterium]
SLRFSPNSGSPYRPSMACRLIRASMRVLYELIRICLRCSAVSTGENPSYSHGCTIHFSGV